MRQSGSGHDQALGYESILMQKYYKEMSRAKWLTPLGTTLSPQQVSNETLNTQGHNHRDLSPSVAQPINSKKLTIITRSLFL